MATIHQTKSSWRRRAVFLSGSALTLIAGACSDGSGPSQKTPEATTLAAVSPTQLTGLVGSMVTDLPTVLVRDAEGRPAEGVLVKFAVTGGGSISGDVVKSSANGLARLRGWTLNTVPGINTVTAVTDQGVSIGFVADGITGPAATLDKFSGDSQVAGPGGEIPNPPFVIVADRFGNPIKDVTVTFDVGSGGGAVTGAITTTDALGLAGVGSWILGNHGPQTLTATGAGLPPVVFIAALHGTLQCGASRDLARGSVLQSTLDATVCEGADGRLFEVYTLALPNNPSWRFTMSSGDFDIFLELRDQDGALVANNERGSVRSDTLKAILPAGGYTLVASSFFGNTTGKYDISYTTGSGSADVCEPTFIAAGVTIARTVESRSCQPEQSSMMVGRYRIHMTAGSSVDIRLTDESYFGPHFDVTDDRHNVLGTGKSNHLFDGGQLHFIAPVTAWYGIDISGEDLDTFITYVLTVK